MLFEPVRHVKNPRFGAVIFRRTSPEITAEGGIWDESFSTYGPLGGIPNSSKLRWNFPGGGTIGFGHMQYEQDLLKWHSAQIPLIEFDELTTFTERQFVYMLTRGRSTSGVRPYIRATCNPDAGSWVAKWVDWYIDQSTGYPIPARAGRVRWFVRDGDALHWENSKERLDELFPGKEPKSFTFIPAKLEDNKILMRKDPGYRASLEAQVSVDRERLLHGNWKIRAGGTWFDRSNIAGWLPYLPHGTEAIRYWDTAATVGETSCETAGVLIGRIPDGRFAVGDVFSGKWRPIERDNAIRSTAAVDRTRPGVRMLGTWIEQEPGGSGVADVESIIRTLAGFDVRAWKETGDKDVRIKGFAAQWESHNVLMVEGPWNESYLAQMGTIPGGKLRDKADASAGAFNRLVEGGSSALPPVTADAGQSVHDQLPDYTFQ